jgi:phosphosulfolactate phosphohydrolase-like enzyme
MAERNETFHLLRLGIAKRVSLSRTIQRFQFMLDTKEPATVVPTVLSGNVRVSLSFGNLDEAFAAQERYSNPIKLIGERLQTEKNYYVYIEPLTPQAEVSLVVQ